MITRHGFTIMRHGYNKLKWLIFIGCIFYSATEKNLHVANWNFYIPHSNQRNTKLLEHAPFSQPSAHHLMNAFKWMHLNYYTSYSFHSTNYLYTFPPLKNIQMLGIINETCQKLLPFSPKNHYSCKIFLSSFDYFYSYRKKGNALVSDIILCGSPSRK